MRAVHDFSLVFGTNIWSHYQAALAEELVKRHRTGNVSMALFEPVPEERQRLGWSTRTIRRDWVRGPPSNESERRALHRACVDADVMIFGACDWEVLRARRAAHKLTLVSAERLLKKPFHRLRLLNPRYAAGFARFCAKVNDDKVHALTIGHFAPADLHAIGAFRGRMWRWGYFPSVPRDPPPARLEQPIRVLWAGRFLKWKRVDTLIRAIARIQNARWFGGCTLIGEGPDEVRLRRIAGALKLRHAAVRFHPPVEPQAVRRWMRESDVYVLASNRGEGWGVVANEAMAEGCVLVANEQAGASRELVIHSETGYLFQDGNVEELAGVLELIGRDPARAASIRERARSRIVDVWSPEVGAERLLALCEGLLAGRPPAFADGPCAAVE